MTNRAIMLAVKIYRAWPYRPHCNAAASRHAWTCRLAAPLLKRPDWDSMPKPDCF